MLLDRYNGSLFKEVYPGRSFELLLMACLEA
jgi:hypothetical protein